MSDPLERSLAEAERAARLLTDACREIGIKLPSVRADFPILETSIVNLGRCRADVVIQLAEWITAHRLSDPD